jgi:hypothetical protein
MPKVTKLFFEYIVQAVTQNYLIVAAITSYTQAKWQTANLPFGLGKTTLALDLMYVLCGGKWSDLVNNTSEQRVWDKVNALICYDPLNLAKLLEPGRERIDGCVYDDVQATAPSSSSVPIPIRKLANFVSTERPEVPIIFFTTPNLNYISAPLRKLVNFELIVSERGFYEVHKISYYKDFNNPLQDKMHFDYVDENVHEDDEEKKAHREPFPALCTSEQLWYDNWRTEHKRQLYPSLMSALKGYTQLKQWEASGSAVALTSIQGKVIRAGNGYAIRLDNSVGERLHMKDVEMAITATN